MEDTLRGKSTVDREQLVRLNPCFNGRYSQRCLRRALLVLLISLNPCFNGRYSQRVGTAVGVLIGSKS